MSGLGLPMGTFIAPEQWTRTGERFEMDMTCEVETVCMIDGEQVTFEEWVDWVALVVENEE